MFKVIFFFQFLIIYGNKTNLTYNELMVIQKTFKIIQLKMFSIKLKKFSSY